MSTPLYHHLLIIVDWEIAANDLFLTEAEIEPALRKLVANTDGPLHLDEATIAEVLAIEGLDDLRQELDERDMSVYIQTIDAPAPAAPDMSAEEYNTAMDALVHRGSLRDLGVADSLRRKFGKHAGHR